MRKTWKKIAAVSLAAVMGASLAGCSGSKEAPTAAETTKEETTAAATTQAGTTAAEGGETSGEPVTLKITWWGGQTRHDYTQVLLDAYTKSHPNVTFEAYPSGWDGYFDKLATQAASGSMPDIVQMDYLYISTYAKNNSMADLQEFIDDGTIDVSKINPALLNTGLVNGKMAGLVLSTSILSVGYNPEVLAEAGIDKIDPEWTWDDFVSICKTVKEKTGKYGFSIIMADDTNNFNYYVRQHGVPLFAADNKSLGYDDDQIFVDFVNMMTELIDAGAMPNPDEYDAIKAVGQEAAPVVMGEGAMVTDWNNYAVRMEKVNDKLALATPPTMADGSKGLWSKPGMFFSVAESSKVKKEAAEFIDWFLNSEEANDIMMAERGTPVSSDIRSYMKNSGKLSPKQIEMFDYADQAIAICGETPAPDPAGISEVNEAFHTAVYSVLYGQASVEQAAADFRTKANEILSRNN